MLYFFFWQKHVTLLTYCHRKSPRFRQKVSLAWKGWSNERRPNGLLQNKLMIQKASKLLLRRNRWGTWVPGWSERTKPHDFFDGKRFEWWVCTFIEGYSGRWNLFPSENMLKNRSCWYHWCLMVCLKQYYSC